MTQPQMLLIYNSRAGKGSFLTKLPEVIDMFVKGGYRVEVYPTQAAGDAVEKVSKIPGYVSLIVAAGGDGTIDEVVTGLLRSGRDVPVGYIPVGSTNDYAASLKLSFNVLEAVGDVLGGEPQAVDMGEFNNGIFVYVAAFGAFTDVSYATNQDMKNLFGHIAYIMEGVRRMGDIKSYDLRVEVDGELHEGSYIYGMVTNSVSVGGFKGITGKNVLLDDGVFEVLLIHTPKNILELQEIVTVLLSGTMDSPLIEFYRTERVRLWSKEEITWTLDGEYGGAHTYVDIRNRHQCVRIIMDGDKSDVLGGWRKLENKSAGDGQASH